MNEQNIEICKRLIEKAKEDLEFIQYIEKLGVSKEDAIYITILLYGNMLL
ncbi:hypothetical protein HCI99_06370 [Listeria booriae]|uniref:Uncharacterized protein n=1 Tax=Listeria booriae TaxID=1552123 RepID=A0A7X1CBI2_9LIST|nr:hypothetical protein [Listeria booriae]MBC1491447.1 hypothetical protein [Listeria booriae]MBC1893110.1 hypothetical protein [Listeria booriae]MBC1974515.1 hypothetical protein [Listeria booriae]MBC2031806.1 hypothetical protein [Listeria booriae]